MREHKGILISDPGPTPPFPTPWRFVSNAENHICWVWKLIRLIFGTCNLLRGMNFRLQPWRVSSLEKELRTFWGLTSCLMPHHRQYFARIIHFRLFANECKIPNSAFQSNCSVAEAISICIGWEEKRLSSLQSHAQWWVTTPRNPIPAFSQMCLHLTLKSYKRHHSAPRSSRDLPRISGMWLGLDHTWVQQGIFTLLRLFPAPLEDFIHTSLYEGNALFLFVFLSPLFLRTLNEPFLIWLLWGDIVCIFIKCKQEPNN